MAGDKAPKSPDEGAITPVYLALLPAGATDPHGKFVSDKEVQAWWQGSKSVWVCAGFDSHSNCVLFFLGALESQICSFKIFYTCKRENVL